MSTIKDLLKYTEQSRIMHLGDKHLAGYFLDCQIRGLQRKSIEGYAERLRCLVYYAEKLKKDLIDLTKDDICNYILHLQIEGKVSPATVNGRITVYKMFYNWIEEEYDIPNPTHKIKKIREPKKIKRTVHIDDINKIMDSFSRKTFLGMRNRNVLLLMYDAWLRRKEIVSLKINDIDLKTGLILVNGKGNKQRVVPISNELRSMLNKYMIRYSGIIKEYLICNRYGERLQPDALRLIFDKIHKKTGIKSSPHDYRRTGIRDYLANGGSLAVAQALAGHEDPKITTKHYAQLNGRDIMNIKDHITPAKLLKRA